jgi:Family of unknown function (DUF5670)
LKENAMFNLLWAIAAIFLLMWIFGVAAHFTMGGLLHVLLVLAVGAVLFRLVMGRRIA